MLARITIAALLVWVACFSEKAFAQEARFCYLSQCFATLNEAESAMKSQSVYGNLLERDRDVVAGWGGLNHLYKVADQPAKHFYDPSFSMPQLDHYLPGCASSDPLRPNNCTSEVAAVASWWANEFQVQAGCTLEGGPTIAGQYSEPYYYMGWTYGSDGKPYGYFRFQTLYGGGLMESHPGQNFRRAEYVLRCTSRPDPMTWFYTIDKNLTFDCDANFAPIALPYGTYPAGSIVNAKWCRANKPMPQIVETITQVASCPVNSNPCHPSSGDKSRREIDFEFAGIQFARNYHSLGQFDGGSMSAGWSHTFSQRVALTDGFVAMVTADGYYDRLESVSGNRFRLQNDAGSFFDYLTSGNTSYRLTTIEGDVKEFDSTGKMVSIRNANNPSRNADLIYSGGVLATVMDHVGRNLEFDYESGHLANILLPDGRIIGYAYDSNGRLSQVDYGAGVVKQYHYGESGLAPPGFSYLLTGITSEDGQRYASFGYDAYGRVISSKLHEAGGFVDTTSIVYSSLSTATVTNSSGLQRSYTYDATRYKRVLGASDSAGAESNTYSSNRLTRHVDRNGVRTDYTYGYFLSGITEGYSTPVERRTTIGRDSEYRVVRRELFGKTGGIETLRRVEANEFDSVGRRTSSCQIDPGVADGINYACGSQTVAPSGVRQTTKRYCQQADVDLGLCPSTSLLKSVDALGDQSSSEYVYTYYASDDASCATAPTTCPHRKGDLWKVTDALGRITETLAYDGAGRPLSVKDANGVITDLTYHPRGWLTARKVRGTNNAVETDDQVTQIEYWPTGLVKKVTQPDGAFTAYTYDAAHRLTDIADNAGNTIHYTLDNAGNRTAEDTKDSGGNLKRTLSRVYNQLGQLQTAKDAYNHATGFTYDANGNNQLVTDALSRVTDNDYDPLNRLARTLQDVGGIAAETKFEYDALDNLTKVTDPKGLDTTYQYNGFGDLTQLASPDTGTTVYTYDSAGNRKTQTDARGIVSTYSYDALNRLTGIAYPTSSLNVGYIYDTANPVCTTGETFAIGRLSKMTDSSGDTQYCYDRFGNLTRKRQTTNGLVFELRYAYTLAGQLQAITYPDGAIVDNVRDGQGRITEVGATPAGGTRQILLNQATYHPFGPVAGWTYGNGRTMSRPLNQNYQPTAVADNATGGLSLGYEFDAVGNLSKLYNADQSVTKAQYVYDALNRLADVKDGPTGTVIEHYGYDATGNRTSFTNAGGTTSYTYPTTNHRLTQVGATARTYDNVGNTTQIGGTAKEFVYNDSGRMSQVKTSGTATMNYLLNGRGEQVRKFLNTNNTYTVYDEAGQWIGDYDNSGNALQQAIWLGDLPVGLLASNQLKYLQPDHLGTPRTVIDSVTDVPIWSWELKGEAFGSTAPNQDPDNNGTSLVFNMRFPGQRYDVASDLNYNYFRDYEPGSGRYMESDPLGQRAGVNTFAYAAGSPLNAYDPYGLKVIWKGTVVSGALIDGVGAGVFVFDLKSDCVNGKQVSAVVIAPAVAAGFGAKATGGGSSVQLHDWTNDPNADTLNGVFVAISAGIVVGGGGGWSKYTVGNAYSDGLGWMPQGPAYGFDFSVGAFVGSAAVVSSSTATCDENCQGSSR